MLVELQSEAFKIGETLRDKIIFHKGLNAVVAVDSSNNSVGKTSFLLALDFVFGGDTYSDDEVGIKENVKSHTLNFAFDFGDGLKKFSRAIQTPDVVKVCGNDYSEIIETISIKEYRQRLSVFYGVESLGMSFREVVSPFSRISHKSSKNLKVFLKDAGNEYTGNGVERLEKLFEVFSQVEAEKNDFTNALSVSETFSKAQKLSLISGGNLKKRDIDDIQKQIEELETENKDLIEKLDNEELLKLDQEQAEKVAHIQGQLQPLRLKRTRIQNKVEYTQKTLDGLLAPTKQELEVLQTFFPDTNMKKLYAVEEFHNSISSILQEELKQNLVQYALDLQNINSEISVLDNSLQTYSTGKTLSNAAYIEYAERFNKIQKLREILDNFNKNGNLKLSVDTTRNNLFKKEIDLLNQLATKVNNNIAELNGKIQKGKWTNPELLFEEPKTTTAKGISNYSLTSKGDKGDGTQGADVLLFDFSVLKLTKLPFLIHDGFVRKELDLDREQDFIKLYASETEKQIFTEFNTINQFRPEIQELIQKKVSVVEIGSGINGLFGRSFSTKKN